MNYEQESRRRLQEDMKIATVMRRVMVVKNNNNFPTITEIFFFRFEILLEMHFHCAERQFRKNIIL